MASDCSLFSSSLKQNDFLADAVRSDTAIPGQCKYNSSPMNDTQVSTWKVLCSSCIYQTVQKKNIQCLQVSALNT